MSCSLDSFHNTTSSNFSDSWSEGSSDAKWLNKNGNNRSYQYKLEKHAILLKITDHKTGKGELFRINLYQRNGKRYSPEQIIALANNASFIAQKVGAYLNQLNLINDNDWSDLDISENGTSLTRNGDKEQKITHADRYTKQKIVNTGDHNRLVYEGTTEESRYQNEKIEFKELIDTSKATPKDETNLDQIKVTRIFQKIVFALNNPSLTPQKAPAQSTTFNVQRPVSPPRGNRHNLHEISPIRSSGDNEEDNMSLDSLSLDTASPKNSPTRTTTVEVIDYQQIYDESFLEYQRAFEQALESAKRASCFSLNKDDTVSLFIKTTELQLLRTVKQEDDDNAFEIKRDAIENAKRQILARYQSERNDSPLGSTDDESLSDQRFHSPVQTEDSYSVSLSSLCLSEDSTYSTSFLAYQTAFEDAIKNAKRDDNYPSNKSNTVFLFIKKTKKQLLEQIQRENNTTALNAIKVAALNNAESQVFVDYQYQTDHSSSDNADSEGSPSPMSNASNMTDSPSFNSTSRSFIRGSRNNFDSKVRGLLADSTSTEVNKKSIKDFRKGLLGFFTYNSSTKSGNQLLKDKVTNSAPFDSVIRHLEKAIHNFNDHTKATNSQALGFHVCGEFILALSLMTKHKDEFTSLREEEQKLLTAYLEQASDFMRAVKTSYKKTHPSKEAPSEFFVKAFLNIRTVKNNLDHINTYRPTQLIDFIEGNAIRA
jgi:hypothetical protein